MACKNHLEGDQPVQAYLASLVYDTHAASAKFGNDFITSDRKRPGG